ncbi:lysine-N-methylase [Escherichia marmotae]|jgi:lysine-N-methylase|uniref:Lysine-N-methylase n=1 Tax=Escherichia marmotae TaxID=1499973 RepID=A0ABU1C5M0_9ESCH|nr:lysine-N-methylase [Escherichia marmotae]MDQ9214850.1 lysine-N-methylase [Escherichia marmotae]MDQ9229789.1 lysine-N-methylase [Escherichia marmotae]MDQ9234454.1 lysine-N-methylase [Escherichia marmotae]MDQ9252720.1 lysine-N-methylase [Escherichia marmotae]MDQ9295948.1 lysine-N-methylase [Escherichia marmotae]
MSFIECYEPEYVRNFLACHPASPLYVRKVWKNEIRQSLALTDIASCEAVLNDSSAFELQLTYRSVEESAAELSARDAIVNQVILSTLALADLTPELSLYAVGLLLSRASKMPGRDGDTLARLTTLPQALADHAQKGTLQAQFARLPSVPHIARQLVTLLGNFAFDWSILPESPRKASLPLQVTLLTLHDANSEALLQQQLQTQWQTTCQQYFTASPWILRNYLIYRVYHDAIGQADGADYFPLVCDFYLIRTLISLWTLDGPPLRQEDIFALFAVFERWRASENALLIRQQIQAECCADPLLYAFSLLPC